MEKVAINLSYEPMQFADGVIARFNGLAVGRVYRKPGDMAWTVQFGAVDRLFNLASENAGKAILLGFCASEEPWPARPTFRHVS